SADGMAWIHDSVRESCPDAIVCLDAFHVVRWANDALDKIRREVWNDTRKHHKRGRPPTDIKARATRVTHSRWALVTNPARLTDKQALTLAELEKAGSPLWKAYLLKELLRTLLKLPADETIERLDTWLDRVDESGLDEFARAPPRSATWGRNSRRY
ncbi:MAG: transposase, partial [Thermoleophilia bacterium]|nr:transposase [Thermoleophilia bacterium]